MRPVAVVTDTTHYLPPDLLAAKEIRQVSLYVNWQGRQDREADLADLADLAEYYDHLRTAVRLPTTSQPSVGDFLEVYEPLVAEGRDVLSVHISAGLSGTYEAALQAKAQIEEQTGETRVTVLDSQTAAGGLGMMVLAAAAKAQGGSDLEATAAHARAARAQLKIWFAIETMEFLRRGGRVGAARAWLGSTLKIKPILTLEQQVTPIERVRTSGRAFERLVDYLRSRCDDGADGWVVQHIQAPEQAQRMVDQGREIFGCEPLWVSEVGPVIGTHAGPGMLGVGGLPRGCLEPS